MDINCDVLGFGSLALDNGWMRLDGGAKEWCWLGVFWTGFRLGTLKYGERL